MAAPDANPYAPPDAAVQDVVSEDDIRRDGALLVMRIEGGLHSCCAHCGSTDDLVARNPLVLWRHPAGCLGTIALTIAMIVSMSFIEDLPPSWRDGAFIAMVAFPIAIIVLNVVCRSRRFRVHYSLCAPCRARRKRWLVLWLVLGALVLLISAMVFGPLWFVVLILYVVAVRFQPAWLQPRRVRDGRVWLRGATYEVRHRFPELERDGDGAV